METLENWDGEWTTAEPHLNGEEHLLQIVGPTSCFGVGGEREAATCRRHPVDQQLLLLEEGLVAGPRGGGGSHCDLSGQTSSLDYIYGLVPRAAGVDTSADCGALWSVLPVSKSPTSINIIQSGASSILKSRKRRRDPDKCVEVGSVPAINSISFQQQGAGVLDQDAVEPDAEAIQQMKEMIYRAAAFRPVNLGAEAEVAAEKPRRRKNVRISTDPQTVAARQRRERISERLRVLQTLVPGGSKLDTASMLDEAANYLKFLRSQVKALQAMPPNSSPSNAISININGLTFNFSSFPYGYANNNIQSRQPPI